MNPKYIMKAIEYARTFMFVPPELTSKIIKSSGVSKDKSILVAFSYEMLPVLKEEGYKKVTLLVDNPRTSIYNIAKYCGYKVKTFPEMSKMKFDLVIGNPPYGKNASLAVKFLNEVSKYSKNIWMILPRTFRKPSVLNRIHKNLHLEKDVEVADDMFPGSIVTCYQHWTVKKKNRSRIKTVSKHSDFEFVTPRKADICVGRVGAGPCGNVYMDKFLKRSPNSHYFIKVANQKVLRKIKSLAPKFREAGQHTVGCPSLSKNDLIRIYEGSYVE